MGWMLFSSPPMSAQNFSNRTISKVKRSVVRIIIEKHPDQIGKPSGLLNDKSNLYYKNLIQKSNSHPFGSGFFYAPRKSQPYIITNEHVIVMAKYGNIKAKINGRSYPLRLVGADTFYDIAVLEFKNPDDIPKDIHKLNFDNSKAHDLQKVCVVAAPNGGNFITKGEISGIHIDRTGISGHRKYLEHDAQTIKGCSGSPLINSKGQVVGINTRKNIHSRQSISYALDGLLAKRLIDEIISSSKLATDKIGRVSRPFLGMVFVQKYDYDGMQWQDQSGIWLEGILPSSPAARAKNASTIVGNRYYVKAVNGIGVRSLHVLLETLEESTHGDAIQFVLSKADDSQITQLIVETDELSKGNMEKISKYFLDRYKINAQIRDRLVELKGNFNQPDIKVLVPRSISILKGLLSSDSYKTFAGSPYESIIKYQIQNMFDLGVLIRLCSMEGSLSLYTSGGSVIKFSDESIRKLYF